MIRKIQWHSVALFASILCVAFVAGAQTSAVAPRITQPIDETNLVTLKGNVHPKARAEFDQGLVPDSQPLQRLLLVLQRSPAQEAALRNLMDQQQDKSSANYHKWLTPQQFGQLYGPADADMQAVTGWLQSHGFTVNSVTKGRTVIDFTGTAGLVREAFHTEIHKYLVNGESHIANSTDPQIPAALAPVVAGVSSLHDFFPKPHFIRSPEKFTAKVVAGQKPHFSSDGQNALGPADFAEIYNINPLYTDGKNGSGRTAAVLGVTDIVDADISDFDSVFELPGGNWSEIHNGPDPGIIDSGDQLEATLDNEWAGATGQGASIKFVVSQTTQTSFGTDLSAVYVTDNNLADVMTVSYGACELEGFTLSGAQQESAISEQAAAQGITYTASTGDAGAEDCDDPNTETVAVGPISVDMPGSSPFNVAVGGTMFNEGSGTYWSSTSNPNTFESALSYIPENVWNESCTVAQCGASDASIAAGGGGVSQYFGLPAWQTNAGVPNSPAGHAGRGVPDVAFSAAGHDPYLICLNRSCLPNGQDEISFEGVGGTSASTPSFAGIISIIDQYTGSRQGQADYVLYALASAETFSSCNGSGTPALSATSGCVFNDTTVGNNAVPGETGYGNAGADYQAKTGWDPASGLGSVNVNELATKWSSATFNSTTTTLSGVPSTATAGQSISNVQITVSAGSGTPGGDVSIIATPTSGSAVGFAFVTLSGGSATTSISFSAGGTYSVVAHYAGNGTSFAPSNSSPATITVTGGGGGGGAYTVNANPTTGTIATPGGTSMSTVTVAGSGGFTGTVNVSCAVAGTNSGDTEIPTCSFSGGGTTVAANLSTSTTSVAETLDIATTAATSQIIVPTSSEPPAMRHIHVVPAVAASGTLFLAIFFLIASTTPKQRWGRFAALVVFASLAGLASCGGSGGGGGGGGGGTSNPGTTPDTYTVTVTAMSGSTSHITTFTVTVQ